MALNTQQQEIFDAYVRGESFFMTGPGGCGKSYLIEKIREHANMAGKKVAVTALTGTAACIIGGQTIHGWAGIGVSKESAEEIYKKLYCRPAQKKAWQEVDVLIIDEVSMMSAELFCKLCNLARLVRNNTRFWGGIQVIFSGDFAQLEPVEGRFCFQTEEWRDNLPATYHLTEIVRQSDPVFQKILNELRLGVVSAETKRILNSRIVKDVSEADILVQEDDGKPGYRIKSTMLYPYKRDVSDINKQELDKLKQSGAESRIYESLDSIGGRQQLKPAHADFLDKSLQVTKTIELAVGAQVMLTKNLSVEEGLVNGSRGVVTEFDMDGDPVVVFASGHKLPMPALSFEVDYGKDKLTRKQVPLVLAWAMTIHKAQGASLSDVVTDLRNVFGAGQVYVTLSRVRSLEGLALLGINYNKIRCHPDVKTFYGHAVPIAPLQVVDDCML
jgi:ATP-dependent DNA helicase PIF1